MPLKLKQARTHSLKTNIEKKKFLLLELGLHFYFNPPPPWLGTPSGSEGHLLLSFFLYKKNKRSACLAKGS
uniref:Uncharacterized protein n=1 Tax=Phlebia radiata TaxID=5308 RepID=L8B978_PHLRA|nr:hypothetical protein PRA_mt0209 [Phlebia radiata]CCE89259.1 hypothetical protein PRA_mt0209 [Phlebia radiata]